MSKKISLHTNNYAKKVDNIVNLFKWNNSLELGFPELPTEAIETYDVLVNRYVAEDDKAYMHHATYGYKYGKIFCAYTIHDYDEDAPGMYTNLSVSNDQGLTWLDLGAVAPSMDTMAVYNNNFASQWTYPSAFLNLPSGYYMLINGTSGITNTVNYGSLGSLVRKINSDNTFGDLLWVDNGTEGDRTAPTPVSGFPSYSFASESLIEEVITYIKQPGYRPKILFGMQWVWSTQENYVPNTSLNLREPTECIPYNYTESLKVWKCSGIDYNIVQNGEDNSTQTVSELPNDTNSTAKRFINWSPEIIIIVGHTKNSTRTEIGVCLARKNNNTGKYEVADGDVYSLTDNPKTAPVHAGHNKSGGEQLVDIARYGKDYLDVVFSYSKEEIYFKRLNITALI